MLDLLFARFVRIVKVFSVFGVKRLFHLAVYQAKVKWGWGLPVYFPSLQGKAGNVTRIAPFRDDDFAVFFAHPVLWEWRPARAFSIPSPTVPWFRLKEGPGQREGDIKDIWEPARFGWAVPQVLRFLSTRDPECEIVFLRAFQTFWLENPPYCGENWMSAQEAAIRLVMLGVGSRAFAVEKADFLADFVAAHAERILRTRDYALAQNNNHLLSEAAGLMTASLLLPYHTHAAHWFETGCHDFQSGLRKQILPDGAYVQHSANYHRMAIQLICWVDLLLRERKMEWDTDVFDLIQRTIHYLSLHVDSQSGKAIRLGHDDGSLLFRIGEKDDFLATLRVARWIFCGEESVDPADPLRLILNACPRYPDERVCEPSWRETFLADTVLRLQGGDGWALLRVATYHDRPAHADQLDVSIWKNGECFALDAGTYRYSAPAPWINGLKSAMVHNTLTIDGQEPMTDAGRFLWLDWDQGRILRHEEAYVQAEHYGYRKLGLRHVRSLEKTGDGWRVTDVVFPLSSAQDGREHGLRLHWLLPDDDVAVEEQGRCLWLRSSRFSLKVSTEDAGELLYRLIRAGECVCASAGAKVDAREDLCGWFTPDYGAKSARLSWVISFQTAVPATIRTDWIFPKIELK